MAANYSQKNTRFYQDMAYVEEKLDARSISSASVGSPEEEKSYIHQEQAVQSANVSSASSQATAKTGNSFLN